MTEAAAPVHARRRETERAPGCLAVASYNIHRCIGRDGHAAPRRIARILHELRADIIGLQEVDSRPGHAHHESRQMDFLAHVTGLTAVAGHTIQEYNRFYGNVLLTSWPVLAVRRIDLTYPGCEPRGLLDADLEFAGQTVRVMVTHLGLRLAERRYQVQRLLEALAVDHGGLVIVLGDINEWFPVARSLRWLHRHLGRSPALRTFPAHCPLLPLDRIWVRPGHALRSIQVHKTLDARIASDHLPVRAIVQADLGPG